jgi:hypothetical protein
MGADKVYNDLHKNVSITFWKQWANLVMIKRTSMVSSLKLQDDSDSKLYFILACLPHMKASKAWRGIHRG